MSRSHKAVGLLASPFAVLAFLPYHPVPTPYLILLACMGLLWGLKRRAVIAMARVERVKRENHGLSRHPGA